MNFIHKIPEKLENVKSFLGSILPKHTIKWFFCSDLDTHRRTARCNRCAKIVVPASTPFAMAPGLPDQLPVSVSPRLHKAVLRPARASIRDGNVEPFYEQAAGFTFQVDRRVHIAVHGQAALQAAIGAVFQGHTLLDVPAP